MAVVTLEKGQYRKLYRRHSIDWLPKNSRYSLSETRKGFLNLDTMTTRTYSVYQTGDVFRIPVISCLPKKSKVVRTHLQGYLSEQAANKDLKLISTHLAEGRPIKSFKRSLGKAAKPIAKRRKSSGKTMLNGCVLKSVEKSRTRKYSIYCKNMTRANLEVISRNQWDEAYNEIDTATGERAARALSRDPSIRYVYLINGLESFDIGVQAKAIDNALKYMKERVVTLASFVKAEEDCIVKLRKVVYSSTAYTLLLRANFDEDEDVQILREKFTFQNTTKEQLAKVSTQSLLTLSVCQRLTNRALEETALLETYLSGISTAKGTFVDLQKEVADCLERRKLFKVANSMTAVVDRVFQECGREVAASTIRKWYNEFKDYGLFKEDLRGCYDRRMFLDEHNYKRKFQLYLKNEKHLTVDEAKTNLEFIFKANPPTTEKGVKALADLSPLSRSTVQRWMLRCGCKYEKASVSYYTDSHELNLLR